MTEDDLIHFVSSMSGVVTVTAGEANGAPEGAWGDTFFFYDPAEDVPTSQRLPFATIVTSDYDGFDMASDLNRPGVFRLNIAVGHDVYQDLLGHPPAAHADQADIDYTATDRLLPHPVYASQAWVSIVNPGEGTTAQARSLLEAARARAAERHERRRSV